MNKEQRSSLAIGLVMVLAGIWFLALNIFPALGQWWSNTVDWPLAVIGAGLLLLLLAILAGAPGLAVPASIVTGIGGLLWWQNATDNWGSWAYAWTLIPGFVGIGIILTALLEGRSNFREGMGMILTSLVLFVIFGTFLGGIPLFGQFWPVLLILVGVWLLVRPMLGRRNL